MTSHFLQFHFLQTNTICRYEQCSWGWNDRNKFEEMTDDSAWYLIAQSIDGSYLGFSHFRFDLDEGQEVLYW